MAALDERLERYAELAVRVGANVATGQTVFITARVEHARFARALTRAVLRRGRPYVDVLYTDQHVRRAMIEHGPDRRSRTPAWLVERWQAMSGNATIGTTGDPEPQLLADLPGERVGRARMTELDRGADGADGRTPVNWTGLAYPTAGWAAKVFGEPDVERLWEAVAFCTRLDEADPVAAWQAHMDSLERRAAALNERQLRRDPLSRPGDRPDGRIARPGPLDERALRDRRRDRVRPEHAHRGDLHDARLPARRRRDQAPAGRSRCRATRRGPDVDLRAGPDREGRRRARRRARHRPARDGRARAVSGRARARRRNVARRARPG